MARTQLNRNSWGTAKDETLACAGLALADYYDVEASLYVINYFVQNFFTGLGTLPPRAGLSNADDAKDPGNQFSSTPYQFSFVFTWSLHAIPALGRLNDNRSELERLARSSLEEQ